MTQVQVRAFAADPLTAPVPPGTVALLALPVDAAGQPVTAGGPIGFAYLPEPEGFAPVTWLAEHDADTPLDGDWLRAAYAARG